MALEATDLFVIQRQDGALLKTTVTQVDDYVSKTLDEVTTLGNTTDNEISVSQVTLSGGGSNTQALQKQEITTLIGAIPAPDLTQYVTKSGDTMIGQLTLPGGGGNTQALQKQEITTLISAIPAPDFSPYVQKAGSNMTGNLTLGTNKITLNATNGSIEAVSIDGGEYAV